MTTKARAEIKQLKFTVPIIVEADTVGFHAYSPALKGLHMGGDTEQEVLDNARGAAAAFLEIMVRDGIPIPLSILTRDDVKKLPRTQDQKGYYAEEITVSVP